VCIVLSPSEERERYGPERGATGTGRAKALRRRELSEYAPTGGECRVLSEPWQEVVRLSRARQGGGQSKGASAAGAERVRC
jgi:hypothetical protein